MVDALVLAMTHAHIVALEARRHRCDSAPNDAVCVEPLEIGEACTLNSECGYGQCDNAIPGDVGLCVVLCDGV